MDFPKYMPLKIIFAGTSEFAVPSLVALLTSDHSVIGVYTPPDRPAGRGLKLTPSPVKVLAEQHRIPIYQPATLRDPQEQETLKNLGADLIVVVAYGLLLPKQILEAPRYGCINIHPSLLPRWRGAAPIPRPIEAGDKKTGVTIMQLDEGLDTGDIWLQASYAIDPEETSQSLHDKLAPISAELLLQTIALLESGTNRPIPQDNTKATYAAKIEKSEAHLNWQEPALILERKIRAFNPWPVVYTTWNDKTLRIWQAKALPKISQPAKPGTIIACDNNGIDVITGEGVLRLLKIQLSGGKPLSVADFVRGHGREIVVGETLCCPLLP